MRAIAAVLTMFALAITFAPSRASASEKTRAFIEIAEAVGVLADSLKKVADAVEHMVVKGDRAYQIVSARNTKSRLKKIYVKTHQLAFQANAEALKAGDDYLQRLRGDMSIPIFWDDVKEKLGTALLMGTEIISDLNQEHSDFVLSEEYIALSAILRTRASMLNRFLSLSPPQTKEELAAFDQMLKVYSGYVTQLKRANSAFASYIR